MDRTQKDISYNMLLRFFLPLALTPFMIGLTHSIINAALARLPFPELSIAVFTVVKSIVSIVASPSLISLQVSLSFIDRKNYLKVNKFLWAVTFFLFLILVLMGYTPLGAWILKNLIGLTGKKEIAFAYTAISIVCFLPLVQSLRNINHGIATALQQTKLIIPGITIRLLSISIFLWWAVKSQFLSGIVAGSLTWVIGIGIQGIFIVFILRHYYGSIKNAVSKIPLKNNTNLSIKDLFKFFIPLGLMMSLRSLIQPIIQGGIARGINPTISLAAYGVAWGLVATISGPLYSLHQVSLVFTSETRESSRKKVNHFSIMVGLFICFIIISIALTPIGNWLLQEVIAVSLPVALLAKKIMLALAFYPFIRALRETYWGLLMKKQTTNSIALGKIFNVAIVSLTILTGINISNIQPGLLGAIAFTLGEGVESLLIWQHGKRYQKNKKPEA